LHARDVVGQDVGQAGLEPVDVPGADQAGAAEQQPGEHGGGGDPGPGAAGSGGGGARGGAGGPPVGRGGRPPARRTSNSAAPPGDASVLRGQTRYSVSLILPQTLPTGSYPMMTTPSSAFHTEYLGPGRLTCVWTSIPRYSRRTNTPS